MTSPTLIFIEHVYMCERCETNIRMERDKEVVQPFTVESETVSSIVWHCTRVELRTSGKYSFFDDGTWNRDALPADSPVRQRVLADHAKGNHRSLEELLARPPCTSMASGPTRAESKPGDTMLASEDIVIQGGNFQYSNGVWSSDHPQYDRVPPGAKIDGKITIMIAKQ